jgi:hypothetical protein
MGSQQIAVARVQFDAVSVNRFTRNPMAATNKVIMGLTQLKMQ